MNCLLCKSGEPVKSSEAYFAKLNGGYLIIENVPCWKCAQCGEILFAASVMEKIEALIETYKKIASKIFIVDYGQAA